MKSPADYLANPVKRPDRDRAEEILLYQQTTGELYEDKKRVVRWIMALMQAHRYDPAQGAKLWRRYIELSVQRYYREFGTKTSFTPSTKATAARMMAREVENEIRAGEWEYLLTEQRVSRGGGGVR